jgi:peptide/nickel transport system permease protein
MKSAVNLIAFIKRFARNPGALAGSILMLGIFAAAILAPLLYPGDPLHIVAGSEIWPGTSQKYFLGTDALGRDIAAMIFHGAQASLIIGLFSALTATVIGVTVGSLAAYFGGWVDEIVMRTAELFQTVPGLIFLLTIVSIMGPTLMNITIAIGFVSWNGLARLTRVEFLSLRERDFVNACRAMGMGTPRIIFTEILPNALPPIIVLASLTVASAILYESALSFLGLGDPNVASWGRLVGEGRTLIRTSWFISAIPGVVIMLAVLSLNLVGDGLNDALNPKLRDL